MNLMRVWRSWAAGERAELQAGEEEPHAWRLAASGSWRPREMRAVGSGCSGA